MTTTTLDWIELDVALRGTGVDPQGLANGGQLIIVEDVDAATVGAPCWYGIRASEASIEDATADYIKSGGTASYVYFPEVR